MMADDLDAATMTLGIDSDLESDSWYTTEFFEAWGIDAGRARDEGRDRAKLERRF